jgi:hypothetical protein
MRAAAVASCTVAAKNIRPTESLIYRVIDSIDAGRPVSADEIAEIAKLMDELDEIYWELSDNGESDAALNAFSKARLYAAVRYACLGITPENIAECVYEAALSMHAPDDVIDAVAELFKQ